MRESYINNGLNSNRNSMDGASDDYDNVKDLRQDNTLQSSTAQVKNVMKAVKNRCSYLQTQSDRIQNLGQSEIYVRLKEHKWSILAFVCGVILTLAIVVPVMFVKCSSSEKDNQAGYIFSLRFDRKPTHSVVFLSDDNKVLSNSFTKETPNLVNHPEQFNTYKGTIGDRCLTSTSKIYFEIMFSFEILKSLNSTNLVVEVGVASRKKTDTEYYIGQHGWSFVIHNCNTDICLTANHFDANTDKEIKVISSSNTAGTLVSGRLGFFVNMKRNEFSVIDKDSSKILFTFTKLVSADQLCLTFGVYNPHLLESKLEIIYSYDFTNLPLMNVVA
ncbi:unnamed protein product [Mytilus edulis]|uniref:B30.2/SPRY domain-containing protein n=1 Tax=Mytilus edulis TaxID=6550 RepID=A0A8S3RLZ5_MYTED|nr:unnamed protein product [Mytilus edulis]